VPNANPQALKDELRRGLKYVRDSRLLVILTALAFLTTSLAMPIATFFPTFATQVLSGHETPAQRLSMLMACQGLGAILGALMVGTLGPFKHMGRSLLTAQILLGLFVAAFAASRSLPLSLLLIFVCGACSMAVFSIAFSLVQLTVPDDLRGRIVSIYMVALRSGGPIGGLIAGGLADRFTAPVVMTASAGLLGLVAATLLLRRRGTLHTI
jgi:predicted MFS family arabinose efflux permease